MTVTTHLSVHAWYNALPSTGHTLIDQLLQMFFSLVVPTSSTVCILIMAHY